MLTVRLLDADRPLMDADSPLMDSDGPLLNFDTAEARGSLWIRTVRLFDAGRPFMDAFSPFMDVRILREDGGDVSPDRVQHVLAHTPV